MAYYHGGAGGLTVGGHILPPSRTGARSKPRGAGFIPTRGQVDRVYLRSGTDAEAHARGFAAALPLGSVYEVEPIGQLEGDMSDVYGNVWVSAKSARVVRVLERDVELTPEMLRWMNTPRDPEEAKGK